MSPVLGGTTPCDMCYYEPGKYSCSDCGQVYCKDCSTKVHKHPQRQHHTPKFAPESDATPESNDIPTDSHMSVSTTGSGKALCFQFPPIYQNKKSLVITPTISLMKDQVTNCRERGINTVFLGSAQPDKNLEDQALSPDSSESIIFVKPEWISKSPNKEKTQRLVRENKLGSIAIDEAHLFHMWPQFRTSYQELETLKIEFPTVPLIALTAAAPLDVQQSIQKFLRAPLVIKESVNRPNIFLSCEELPFSGGKGLSHFTTRVSEILDGNSAIIYTDFIDDIGLIVSEL